MYIISSLLIEWLFSPSPPPFFAAITNNSMNIFEHLCEGYIVNIKQIPDAELLGQSIYAWPILIDNFQVAFPRRYIHVQVSPMGKRELNKAWGSGGGVAVGLSSRFSGSAGGFFVVFF